MAAHLSIRNPMKKIVLILAVFSAFLAAPNAQACSVLAIDRPLTGVEMIADKDAVFTGTVTGVSQDKSVNGEYHITFAVDESYKGSVGDTITVRARSSSAACGYDDGYTSFKKGTVWAIFATGNDTDGYVTTSVTHNAKYASLTNANDALAAKSLSPEEDEPTMCTMQYAPVCGKTASGTVKTFGNSCVLGAEKAEFLYDGECKVAVSAAPTKDLWRGMRGADVSWLQNFLMEKLSGTAAAALKAVGATGYFGPLTTAALAEYQKAQRIGPAAGYFGAKTRAHLNAQSDTKTETFTGTISAVSTACFADGICSVTVDGKEVILLAGLRVAPVPAVGTLKGVDSIGDLEKEIGSKARVYAAKTSEGDADYTLYGNASYYVEVLD